jgi:hypothetical protein
VFFGEGTAYAVFEGHSKTTIHILIKQPIGKTWKSIITADVDGFVRNIQDLYK